ncbi:radial spoke head 10 homolog B isoform X2 [Aplysia californica]|uniref:Radial spoke head 10 homolog B isoform X2 n=1 Tax=Aplysia californica TaxID=6500 RepID=A0ABM1A114_APLCA|nr:radial spoke head 10 homolog B isoform X2 [Aplysia californica]
MIGSYTHSEIFELYLKLYTQILFIKGLKSFCSLLRLFIPLSNMASKEKKKGEKRSGKKTDAEEEKKVETPVTDCVDTPSEDATNAEPAEEPPRDPTPEPTYDEPALSELIVESFEGEKVKGLYEGEGEAQFTGGHYYKGMFSEGCMHGKGVYVWANGTQYEGDFLKNQVTGKGMYTWPNGSTYEGDVSNGKRHGFGTFRSADNRLSYSGDWVLGKKQGKGRMDYDAEGKSYYDGDWVNGIKHGWGTRQYPSGNVYHGMWFNNVRHGEGTMKWLDRDQVYAGQWENGIQHGLGQHIWLLRRVTKSQYPLRNMYDGELVNGLRHGTGVFYYANGAKYEGYWRDNMKHGQGKFTFKNGRIYEGLFEKDHIVEYPDFTMDGSASPDMTQIRTRTPVPTDNVSVHSNDSKNTVSPSFQLEIHTLLATLPADDVEHEVSQVLYSITRHVSALRRIYTYYSMLGYEESPDNTFIMNKMQFWRFLKDIHLHHDRHMLTDMDRLIGANYHKSNYELHNPYEKILQRQFVNYLVILAHLVYKQDYKEKNESGPILEYCFSRLITEKVLRFACMVKSPIYCETRRATNALVHMDQAYEIYQGISTLRKHAPREPMLKMRNFMFLLKELGLVNQDLTPAKILEVLGSDNPGVSDGEGCYNLELEMTFLEFFEALVGCAEVFVTENVVKDPTTPRPSTAMTHDPSMYSVPASPSRMTSQGAGEEGAESVRQQTPFPPSTSPVPQSPVRNASSVALTNKTGGDESNKAGEGSTMNLPGDAPTTKSSQPGSVRQDLPGEMQKSASFISAHTGSEENQPLMQSSVSLIGPDGQPIDNEEAAKAPAPAQTKGEMCSLDSVARLDQTLTQRP